MHSKALRIYLAQKELDHLAISTTRDGIARAHRLKGDFKKSEELYLQALEFERQHLQGA